MSELIVIISRYEVISITQVFDIRAKVICTIQIIGRRCIVDWLGKFSLLEEFEYTSKRNKVEFRRKVYMKLTWGFDSKTGRKKIPESSLYYT